MPRRILHAGTVLQGDPTTFEVLGDGFAHDATRGWFHGSEIPYIDGARLRILGSEYATDGTHVVHGRFGVDADAATFQVIGTIDRAIARDRTRTYIDSDEAGGPDPASLAGLGAGLLVDRDRVWAIASRRFEPLACDRASLRILDADYACDRERAWYRGELLDGAQGATFVALGSGHASDGERLYRRDHLLDIPAAGARVLDEHTLIAGGGVFYFAIIDGADAGTYRSLGDKFGADATSVYFDGDLLDDADPATFAVVIPGWARDRTAVWFHEYLWHDHSDGEMIQRLAIDPATFRAIDSRYGRAADCIFRRTRIVGGADPATFRALGGNWYADATSLWCDTQRIAGADVATLAVFGEYAIVDLDDTEVRILGDGYAVTGHGVLYAGHSLDGPTPETARSLGGGYLVDGTAAWFLELATHSRKMPEYLAHGGRLDGADPATLRRDRAFAIDRGAVFALCQRIDADPASFRALDAHHGTDGRIAMFDTTQIAADPARLRTLGGCYRADDYAWSVRGEIDDAWATDGATLFLCGRPVSDRAGRYIADQDEARLRALAVGELRILDRWYATDGRAVLDLFHARILEMLDAATFEVLGDGYARDRRYVWSRHGRVRANAATFRAVGDRFASDGERLWYDGADAGELRGMLELLGGGWARDGRGILCGSRRSEADRETFVVVGSPAVPEAVWDPAVTEIDDPLWSSELHGLGRDKDGLWWGAHSGMTPADAVAIGHGYALSSTAVYHAGRAFDADAASFIALGDGYARDVTRIYYRGEVTR